MFRLTDAKTISNELAGSAKIFQNFGCLYKRKKGSHHILTYPTAKRAVVIPEYDEIDVDIIKNNMRTVGMSRDQYFELLETV